MTDPLVSTFDALGRGDLAQLPVVVLAGIVTSVGPCVAPRYVALASLLDGRSGRTRTIVAFVGGLVVAYAAIGAAGGFLSVLWARSSAVYAAMALLLVAGGVVTLLRPPVRHREGAHSVARPTGAFVVGAGSALVVSPCCTPVVAAVVGLSSVGHAPAVTAALLCAFALGHAFPLLLAGAAGSLVVRPLAQWSATAAPATISGGLMIALGAYYGLLC